MTQNITANPAENREQPQDKKEMITGLFSSQEVRKVGTGTTTRKTIQKAFWYAKELDDGRIEVQPINPNYIPSGPKRVVERENFLKDFSPEPEFYVSTVYPKMRELNKTVSRAERYRSNNETFSAEMEFNNALTLDEDNVRANFGLGITYLERGETERAANIIDRIVKLDAAFEEEHKHLFNEFGINLRKSRLFDQAISYYERALNLSGPEENLYYNLARAYLENKQPDKTVDSLIETMKLNPTHTEAMRFLMWMLSKNLIPEDRKITVAQTLKTAQAAMASGSGPEQAGQKAGEQTD